MRLFGSLLLFTMILLAAGCEDNGSKDRIEATGNIDAVNITVSSEVTGTVIKFPIEEGELVKAGDTLLVIDPESYLLQLRQAEAATQAAQAQYELLLKGARQEDIFVAEDKVNQAKITFEQAEKDFNRLKALYEKGSATEKQFEEGKLRYDVAKSNYNSAEANLRKVKNIIRPEELRQAEANLRRMMANEDMIKKMLRDCYVTAPTEGFIVDKFIRAGEMAAPLTSLCKIADLRTMELDIYVSEMELGYVKYGQSAVITVDSFPDKTFNGRVSYISPEAEFTPKNIQTKEERTKLVFKVTIAIDNPELELKDGMPADAVIKI